MPILESLQTDIESKKKDQRGQININYKDKGSCLGIEKNCDHVYAMNMLLNQNIHKLKVIDVS